MWCHAIRDSDRLKLFIINFCKCSWASQAEESVALALYMLLQNIANTENKNRLNDGSVDLILTLPRIFFVTYFFLIYVDRSITNTAPNEIAKKRKHLNARFNLISSLYDFVNVSWSSLFLKKKNGAHRLLKDYFTILKISFFISIYIYVYIYIFIYISNYPIYPI